MSSTPPDIEALLAHREFLERLARRLVHEPDAAADLVQETWLRALASPPPRAENPRGWLRAVARNVLRRGAERERARRVEPEQDVELVPTAPPAEPPVDALARSEIAERLAEAVRALDEPYRTVLLLRYWEDLSPTAIAARLARPVNTVTSQLRRGLDKLRERLDHEHGGDRERWTSALVVLLRAPSAPSAPPGSRPRPRAAPAGPREHRLAGWLLGAGALSLAAFLVAQRPGAVPRLAAGAEAGLAPAERALSIVEPLATEPARRGPGPPPRTDAEPSAAPRLLVEVLDERDRPVERALVHVTHADPATPWQVRVDGEHYTGPDGRVSIPLAEHHAVRLAGTNEPLVVGVVVQAEGLARTPLHGAPFPAEGTVRLLVRVPGPALRVSGRVTDSEGLPLEAFVQFGPEVPQRTSRPDGTFVRVAPTGPRSAADGTFVAPALERALHPVLVEAEGYLPFRGVLDGRGRDEARLDARLHRGAALRGRVVDAGGAPVAGARVRTSFRYGGPLMLERRDFTDAEGRYALRGLPPRRLWITAEVRDRPELCTVAAVTLAAGEERAETLVLGGAATVTLRVETDEGRPLAGAGLHLYAKRYGEDREQRTATGEDGRVTIGCLPAGERFTLAVYASPASAQETGLPWLVRDVAPGPAELRVVVPAERLRAGAFEGRITDAAGAPVADALVHACVAGGTMYVSVPIDPVTGSFGRADAPPQRYELVAVCPGAGAAPLGTVEVVTGATREMGEFRLPAPADVTVEWHAALDPERGFALVAQVPRSDGSAKLWHVLTGVAPPPGVLRLLPGHYELRVVRRGVVEEVERFEVAPGTPHTVVVGAR